MTTKYVPCKALKEQGSFWSDGVTPCWSADIECDQGSAVFAQTWGKTAEEAEANARLIAAAPELLEALDDCLTVLNDPIVGTIHHDEPQWYGETHVAVAKASAAIAKAKGAA